MRARGFTLLELLAVVAVIGILIGVVLPAVQAAREAARRTHCANNFRQMGLALHQYHDSLSTFPIGRFGLFSSNAGGVKYLNRQTWIVGTLPYLEQTTLFSAYNASLAFVDPANSTAVRVSVPTFLCPSDSASIQEPDTPWARVKANVAANWGNTTYFQDERIPGMSGLNPFSGPVDDAAFTGAPFRANRSSSLAEFRDGASLTILLAETVIGQNRPSGAGPTGASDHRGDVYNDDQNATMFMTYTPPNARVPDQMGDERYCGYGFSHNPPCNALSPTFNASRSRHPGGVYALFGDGRVQFVRDTIDLALWRALGSPSGCEVVSDITF